MPNVTSVANGSYINVRLVSSLLGGDFSNCKKEGIVSYGIALNYDPNIGSTHANIYSDLPNGTPRSAKELDYLIVEMPDGKFKALALSWIDTDVSVIEYVMATATLKLENQTELERLRKHLISGGFDLLSMEIKNV